MWGKTQRAKWQKVGYRGQKKNAKSPNPKSAEYVYSLSLPSESGSDPAMFRMLWRVCDETWKLPSTSQVHATCPPQYATTNMLVLLYTYSKTILVDLLDNFSQGL